MTVQGDLIRICYNRNPGAQLPARVSKAVFVAASSGEKEILAHPQNEPGMIFDVTSWIRTRPHVAEAARVISP